MLYVFEGHCLDPSRRELRRGDAAVCVEPQVFDLLEHLLRHRERVVSRDELLASVWKGRIVSESALASRIFAARQAIGDDGRRQRLIRTLARKGLRFVGAVHEVQRLDGPGAAAASAAAEAQRGPLTVLACNFAGAATLARRVDPEELRELMVRRVDAARSAVESWGGRCAQVNTDGLRACFGYPQPREDDAERAVHAALAIQRDAAAERVPVIETLPPRIGIATGTVVVGAPAGPDAALPLTGQAPLLAAALAAACAGSVLICPDTRRLLGGLFACRDAGTVPLDAGEGLAATAVVGADTRLSRFEALRQAAPGLIGRDEELALLQRRWQQARSGEGRVVLIGGEAGIGKSHLVAALQHGLGDMPRTIRRLSCSPHRSRTALHPLVVELETAAGFELGDSDATRHDKLARLLERDGARGEHDLALFAELLAIGGAGREALPPLSAARRKELTLERLLAWLAQPAAAGALLVIVEDAHWIDPTTLELLDAWVEQVRALPALCLVTHRPEFAPPWLGAAHVSALVLSRLGYGDIAALALRSAGERRLCAELIDQIAARSDGVPLFVEELTRSILESGLLHEHEGLYRLDRSLRALAVPSSLQASLAARLERIGPAHALAQISAALGREFGYAELRAISGLGDDELAAQLGRFVASGLIHARGVPPHARYVFKHALVQDAAHASMLKARRAAVHRRIADVFAREFAPTVERHPEWMAYHCAEAGLWPQAIEHRLRATRQALERCAGIEARAQVQAGLELLPHVTDAGSGATLEGRLHVALGDTLTMTQGFASPEVHAAMTRARELLDDEAHPIEALRALCGLFNYHLIRSESPHCLRLAEPFLARATAPRARTVAHYLVGTACLHLGDFERSIGHLDQALAQWDESGCREVAFVGGYHLRSFTLIWLALACLYVGALPRARSTIAAAVADARSRSHPFTLVSALLALARFCSHVQDLPGAIAATDEGLAIATEQRSPYHLSRAAILQAINRVDGGCGAAALGAFEQALAAHRATGADFQSSYNLSRLADAHAQAGHIDLALDHATRALAEVERSGERWWLAEALRGKGEILRRAGRDAQALGCFRKALACARRQHAKLWELQAALSIAECCSRQGRPDAARQALEAVGAAFADAAALPQAEHARLLLGRLRAEAGAKVG